MAVLNRLGLCEQVDRPRDTYSDIMSSHSRQMYIDLSSCYCDDNGCTKYSEGHLDAKMFLDAIIILVSRLVLISCILTQLTTCINGLSPPHSAAKRSSMAGKYNHFGQSKIQCLSSLISMGCSTYAPTKPLLIQERKIN